MNAEEICLCFILVVDSCECQATNVFDEMFERKFIDFKKKLRSCVRLLYHVIK
jgi:hypothetical protein